MADQRSPYEIRQDIANTREQMDRTIDELGRRLSPGEFLERAWSRVKDDGPSAVGDLIRSHPLPFAALGAGLIWLAIDIAAKNGDDARLGRADRFHGLQPDRSGLGDPASTHHDAAAWETWHDEATWDQEPPTVNRLTRAAASLRSVVGRRPLAAGAVALGLGLAAGLAAPSCRLEDRLRQVRDDAALA